MLEISLYFTLGEPQISETGLSQFREFILPGLRMHACDSLRRFRQQLLKVVEAPWKAEAGGSPGVRNSRLAWPTWQNPVSTKKYKT